MPTSTSDPAAAGSLLCLGYGYSARHLAARLRPLGWRVAGTSRDGSTTAEDGTPLRAMGQGQPLPEEAWTGVTHVLVSVPPDRDTGLDAAFAAATGRLQRQPGLAWVGYLSTTGVYGDAQGAWVDEGTPPNPGDLRTTARLAAEQAWLGLAPAVPVHAFRLSGIYGPGRNALRQLRAGRAKRVHAKGQVTNRIHVSDIAATLEASMARPAPGTVYNVSDDLPWPAHAVVAYASGLLGVVPPPAIGLDDPSLAGMSRSFLAGSRRVANRRIKAELGVRLAYPTFRDGLDALFAAGE